MNEVENTFVANGQGIDNTSTSIPSIISLDPSLRQQRQQQTVLRNLLKDKNSGTIATEKKYAIADGNYLDRLNTAMIEDNTIISSNVTINQSTTNMVNGDTTTLSSSQLSVANYYYCYLFRYFYNDAKISSLFFSYSSILIIPSLCNSVIFCKRLSTESFVPRSILDIAIPCSCCI
jgi:hypothetical protein